MTAEGVDAKAWYLVYTKPRQESLAQVNLERQGFPVYLPKARQRRREGREVTDVIEPLFPRYLFIHLSRQADNWGSIRSTLGVSSLVRFGPDPAVVPDPFIVQLRDREDEHGLQAVVSRDLRPGDPVRMEAGYLQGYEGIFLAGTSGDRVSLLLEMLGKQVRVLVGRADLEPLK